jgi:hypothetical protein
MGIPAQDPVPSSELLAASLVADVLYVQVLADSDAVVNSNCLKLLQPLQVTGLRPWVG